MVQDLVQSLILEGSLESVIQLVSVADSVADDLEQQLKIRKQLLNWLEDHRLLNYDPFFFVGPKRALQYFAARIIIYSINSAKHNGEPLSYSWLLSILQDFEPSSDPLLAMTEAKRLLALTDKYSARRRLAFNCGGLPVNFLFIPYRHKRNNGFFVPGYNYILAFRTKRCSKNTAPYIFMHELGHAFQYYSTGDVDTVPDSFMEVYNQMFTPSQNLPEIFADCFSVAAMYGTPYAKENPFCQIFAVQHQELLVEYFKNEFSEE